jgi:2-polyprenyl-6-hydroxyphenyl methylase/3-demethylubiquinone-9 3-methyltransferase
MTTPPRNASPSELGHFDRLAGRWWDPEGEFRTLHDINPARVELVDRMAGLKGRRCVDVGCGGGLFSEAMAARGATVLGIDLAPAALEVARLHLLESGVGGVSYEEISAEELARREAGSFDLVTCMELLEHVPDPASLVESCARLVRPGGSVIFSSLNRSLRSWLLAIVGAEYVTGIVPRGTHRYDQLVRPSELDAWARHAGLELRELAGLHYDPLNRHCRVDDRPTVNYVACFHAPGGPDRDR